MQIDTFQTIEFISGALIVWVGIYLFSRNPKPTLSKIITLYLISLAVVLIFDVVLRNTPDVAVYLRWQKATDWTVFFIPVFFYHASIIVTNKKDAFYRYLLIIYYSIAFIATIIDIFSSLILRSDIYRFEDFRRYDGFYPGPLLYPIMIILLSATFIGNILWAFAKENNKKRKYFPLLGGMVLLITHAFGIAGFYYSIKTADILMGVGVIISALIFIYSIFRYYLFQPNEKIIFNKAFYIKTLLMIIILMCYLPLFFFINPATSYNFIAAVSLLIILIMVTHSFYDWFSTFLNDLIYNLSSGLSIVNDEEVYQLIKNYNSPQNLEESPLLRLNIVKKRVAQGELPIDALKNLLDEVIKYFKPKTNMDRRIKSNLKYTLLHMITYDQADEGQILWNLGFNEYPIRIMSQAGRDTNPQYDSNSPADYTYTSRNAYIALKKEAIHNVAWRISYIEKNS